MLSKRRHFMPSDEMAAVLHYPIRESVTQQDETVTGQQPSWFARRLSDIGARTMATPTSPPNWNWAAVTGIIAMLTFCLTLMLALGGAIWVIASMNEHVNSLQQEMQKEREQTQREIEKAQSDAAEAKKFGIYAAAGSDEQNGHKPNQQKQEKK